MLGASCDADRDCAVPYSRCVAGACRCQAYYARYNESRCLPSTLLGFECLVREQCSLKVANSSCIHGFCRCEPGFLQFRRHTCLSPAKPGDVCYSDAHCRLWDGNSHCHFLIPKLFGRCGCNAHMVPRGSECVPSQEDEFPPDVPAHSSTTTTTTTTTAPTTTVTKAASTPTTITSTTAASSAPTTTTAASSTQSQEAPSTTAGAEEYWSSAAPSSESTEPVAVQFSTSDSAPETTSDSDVSIKYPVPSSYPWSTTEEPYRDVTAEMEEDTSLMADATSQPVSSTQSAEPEVLSSSLSAVEAAEDILGSSEATFTEDSLGSSEATSTEDSLGSSEATVDTSSQSEPAGDESVTVGSSTAQSTSRPTDAPTYSSPEAESTTANSESYSEESVDTSSPTITDFIDTQASDMTEATSSVPSHPPPFSVGAELTFDANYATSTDNQPSASTDDSWVSSSSPYSEPTTTITQAAYVSTDDDWISSSASSDPMETTTVATESATNDAEVASPSTEVVTPTQGVSYTSSVEPILQDDTEDMPEESVIEGEQSVTEEVEPSETINNQSTSHGVLVASESVPPSSSSSAPLVQVTSAEKDSTEDDMMVAATSFAAGAWPRAVSLGLPCASDLQCQAADPHSRCVDGACDCAHRTNASNACWAGNRGCHPGTFQCRSSGLCISWFFVCDGRRDCADGSDEECTAVSSSSTGGACPPLSFRCGAGGTCVSRAARCDGNTDCPMGEDEQGCHDRAACPQFTFACSGGGNVSCLPDYELCNAVVSCGDGSDEPQWCRVPPPGAATVAGARAGRRLLRMRVRAFPRTGPRCPFRCDNGRCRSTAILCSGRDGCGDGSDEARCRVCKCAAASD